MLQCQISSMDRGLLFLQWILGSLPSGISLLRHNCYTSACILSSKTNNFGKDSHLKLPVWLEWWSMRNRRELNTGLSTWQTNVETTRLSGTRQLGDHSAIRYSTTTPLISFWLICTTRRWDRGSVCGQTLFLSELFFFGIRAKTHLFSRSRPSFDSRCELCIVPKKTVNIFCLPIKILWETHLFFRSFKTVISSTNSGSHCLSRKCRTYTFNNFSPAKWESRNGGDLFGRTKIDTAKICIQLLQIVILYRGHLNKELRPGISRYSKEWKSCTIDIVPKSA